jgi:hypothetical protein
MAQLALTAATSIGRTLASTAASYAAGVADRLIFGPKKRKVVGPRLDTFQIQASTEGAPILRVFGRARVAGEIIWAANFKETVSTTTESSGKGARLGTKTKTTEYLYSISLAIGLCEGVVDRIGRVFADGKPFDLSRCDFRFHRGTEDQLPDAVIEALEGAGRTPAFRGLAYIVFEDLPLKEFGNRIPQFSFEIEKSLRDSDPQSLENALTAVVMIPGSGEFVYGTTPAFREIAEGVTVGENTHNSDGVADFAASLDQLLAAAPNLKSVSLVVSWFGTDLRAGSCLVRPGVEAAAKTTLPYEWRAGGVDRAGAHVVSLHDGRPAYGGTPADRCVLEAIAALKAKGLEVMLHPFILMDIPSGNGLPDPYGGAAQAAYPWRGRITVGAADKTAAAATAIAHFFGTAQPHDFSAAGDHVAYSGPDEWSLRRFILHYARLAAMAGGVDRFLLGSELRGVTTARAAADVFPAVAAMTALAADVKTILPDAKLSYAADWSEYFGHQPADGSGDVFFHLDPFWSSAQVDFVAIDNYLPLADWRDGFAHADALAGFKGPHDRAYLMSRIESGERYDYYYASAQDRIAQQRAPISDGAYGEPWVFRPKDFRSWWANPHHDRPGGARNPAPTAWVPESKPILFAETGCPAVDKGANEPNLFIDPKSAESRLPAFSTGARDDLALRRFIEATLAYWRAPGVNPLSTVTGAPMIEAERTHVYAYDARPYPFFPALADVWGDGANWRLGHWLNGRLGRAPLDLLATALADGAAVDASSLDGAVGGYVLDRPMSPREALSPLADIFRFDCVETADGLRFQAKGAEPLLVIEVGALVESDKGALATSLGQVSDLPAALRVSFIDEAGDYAPAAVEARSPAAGRGRETGLEAPIVIGEAEALARARALLADAEVARLTASFALPPSMAALEPGDVVFLDGARWRIVEIEDRAARKIEAVRAHPSVDDAPPGLETFKIPAAPPSFAPPVFELLDLPAIAEEGDGALLLAAFADPWPGGVALYRDGPSGFEFAGLARARASLGRLEAALPPGPSGRRLDQSLRVRMSFGAFSSKSEAEVLAGANAVAVETAAGFEILQFHAAALESDGSWTLSRLLRGQKGTEDRAAQGAAAGARLVVLNAALAEASYPIDSRGLALTFRAGPEADRPEAASFAEQTAAPTARNLRPLAPVHLRSEKVAGGCQLSFIRRTRMGGDGWESEVPLGETRERYRISIFPPTPGAPPLRVVECAPPFPADPYGRPNILYTDAMILADFGAGAPPPGAAFEVAQISDAVGAGVAARALL